MLASAQAGRGMIGKTWYPLLILVVAFASGRGLKAAELVMFESDSCEWCEKWHQEIGPVYGKTDEARVAPLRRVDIDDQIPEDLRDIKGIHYTPTFVLMDDGQEVGRILGYPGEDFFWGLLSEELAKLKPEASESAAELSGCKNNSGGETVHETSGVRAVAC